MIGAQYEGIMGALEKILDRMPVRDIPNDPAPFSARKFTDEVNGTPAPARAAEVAADKRQALAIVRAVLDDWIKNQRDSMHQVYEHGDEPSGSECWRSFAPSEIRTMINHAARELGVDEFPDPDHPEEDNR